MSTILSQSPARSGNSINTCWLKERRKKRKEGRNENVVYSFLLVAPSQSSIASLPISEILAPCIHWSVLLAIPHVLHTAIALSMSVSVKQVTHLVLLQEYLGLCTSICILESICQVTSPHTHKTCSFLLGL